MMTLIIFARAPQLGQGKRRLAAELGDGETLRVYQALLNRTAAAASSWQGPVTVYGCGDLSAFADSALAALPIQRQSEGSLAQRMAAALQAQLHHGPTLLIGSDCPSLNGHHLTEMQKLLHANEVVLGPATDGGYWGLGLSNGTALHAICNPDLAWSQPSLLSQTQNALHKLGLTAALGPQLADCDTIADLRTAVASGFPYHFPTGIIL